MKFICYYVNFHIKFELSIILHLKKFSIKIIFSKEKKILMKHFEKISLWYNDHTDHIDHTDWYDF